MCEGRITTRDFCESGRRLGNIAAPIVSDVSVGSPSTVVLAGGIFLTILGLIGLTRHRGGDSDAVQP